MLDETKVFRPKEAVLAEKSVPAESRKGRKPKHRNRTETVSVCPLHTMDSVLKRPLDTLLINWVSEQGRRYETDSPDSEPGLSKPYSGMVSKVLSTSHLLGHVGNHVWVFCISEAMRNSCVR